MSNTAQLKEWENQFGKDYTDRNTVTTEGLNKLYMENYGISRSDLNKEFLSDFNRNIRILEVGVNTGNQLLCLQEMSFQNLYGIEPQDYAVDIAQKRTKGINVIKGNIFDIPFKDGYFDMVFTSGVLIHIHPDDLSKALKEIVRCSKELVWGFEYFAETCQSVEYRGNKDLLWKTDFSGVYQSVCDGLTLVKEKRVPYLKSDNVDSMFLLKKETK